jgi:hypothetical protein
MHNTAISDSIHDASLHVPFLLVRFIFGWQLQPECQRVLKNKPLEKRPLSYLYIQVIKYLLPKRGHTTHIFPRLSTLDSGPSFAFTIRIERRGCRKERLVDRSSETNGKSWEWRRVKGKRIIERGSLAGL